METLTKRNSSERMIVKRVSVPNGLEELMEGLTKEVLLKKPKDLYQFASDYFSKLVILREKTSKYKVHPVRSAQSVTKVKAPVIPPVKSTSTQRTTNHFSRHINNRNGKSDEKKPDPATGKDRTKSTDRNNGSVVKTTPRTRSVSSKRKNDSSSTSSVQSTPREKRQPSTSRNAKSQPETGKKEEEASKTNKKKDDKKKKNKTASSAAKIHSAESSSVDNKTSASSNISSDKVTPESDSISSLNNKNENKGDISKQTKTKVNESDRETSFDKVNGDITIPGKNQTEKIYINKENSNNRQGADNKKTDDERINHNADPKDTVTVSSGDKKEDTANSPTNDDANTVKQMQIKDNAIKKENFEDNLDQNIQKINEASDRERDKMETESDHINRHTDPIKNTEVASVARTVETTKSDAGDSSTNDGKLEIKSSQGPELSEKIVPVSGDSEKLHKDDIEKDNDKVSQEKGDFEDPSSNERGKPENSNIHQDNTEPSSLTTGNKKDMELSDTTETVEDARDQRNPVLSSTKQMDEDSDSADKINAISEEEDKSKDQSKHIQHLPLDNF
ncbi:uncharacterized protein LOC143201041 [Rhynchophorus ferrugineus]|uniref:uncharacterized protein LOC143201041 n=1 Tax=Rhynchophorus ferrugineus TaxID=354439 RepID=UPI003FCE2FFC